MRALCSPVVLLVYYLYLFDMRSLLALLSLSVGLELSAQSHRVRCWTVEADSLMRALYPAEWTSLDELEPLLQSAVQAKKQALAQHRTIGGVYQIPVVFHVIHNGEPEGSGRNIPTANILHQLEVLNEDFRRKEGTPGWNDDPHGTDTRIEFVLAKRDPDGNPTTGIVRWNRNDWGWNPPPYNVSYIQTTIKPNTIWEPSQYLNIWVIDVGGGIVGYAQFPSFSALLGMPGDAGDPNGTSNCTQSALTDGVVLTYDVVGSTQKGSTGIAVPYQLGRTATHEVGHWLGLRHPWGDGDCTVDDYCEDTPLCNGASFGCPVNPPSCTPGVRRMIENYMDYSDDGCLNIFTLDQALRMRAVLETSRRSLLSSPGLIPPHPTDAAVADLLVPQDLCPGTYAISVVLQNTGTSTSLTNLPIAYRIDEGPWQTQTWTGTLNPGDTTTFTLIGLSFPTAGWHTLTVCTQLPGDPDGTQDTLTAQLYVHEGFYPLYETFDHGWLGQPIVPTFWRVRNPDQDCITWAAGSCIGEGGQPTTAMHINLFSYPQGGRRDELYTPLIDLTNAPTGVKLEFSLAYRPRGTRKDTLLIEIATECGTLWQSTPLFLQDASTGLATGSALTSRLIPSAASDWQTRTIDLDAYRGQKVRLRFVTKNRYGNALWIDNVRLSHEAMVFWQDSGKIIREELTWAPLAGDCRRYRDLSLPVQISASPSADVTLSLRTAPSSTAREGVDFAILTPTLTFPAGSTIAQNAIVRLFEDQAIEPPRVAELQLSVTSGPATVPANRRTYRLWIEDNDFFPPEVILWQEDFEAGEGGFSYVDLTPGGANKWIRGTGANLGSGFSLYISNNPSADPPPHQYALNSSSRIAAVSPTINTEGATDLVLAFDALVGGQYAGNNLVDFGRVFYSTTSATTGFQPLIGCAWTANTCLLATQQRAQSLYGHPTLVRRIYLKLPPATWNQPNLWLTWRWDNNASAGTQPPLAIDNIVLYGRRAPSVETDPTSTQVYVGPEDSLYVYSPTEGKLLLHIVNLSSRDYGCTEVGIDRAGSGVLPLRADHTTNQAVTEKTFRLSPRNAYPDGPYALTLYYTNSEVVGYESATGQSWEAAPVLVRAEQSIATEYTAPQATYVVSERRVIGNYSTTGRWIRGEFLRLPGAMGFAAGAPPARYEAPLSLQAPIPAARAWVVSPFSAELRFFIEQPFHSLWLYNLAGSVVWQATGPFEAGNYSLSAPNLPAGAYLLEWVGPSGEILARKKILALP